MSYFAQNTTSGNPLKFKGLPEFLCLGFIFCDVKYQGSLGCLLAEMLAELGTQIRMNYCLSCVI